MCEFGDWLLVHNNAPPPQPYNAEIVKACLTKKYATVLNHPQYSTDLAPADYLLFPK